MQDKWIPTPINKVSEAFQAVCYSFDDDHPCGWTGPVRDKPLDASLPAAVALDLALEDGEGHVKQSRVDDGNSVSFHSTGLRELVRG